jgi:FKBP-type peptidyl-prolyl cis-trans isomerase SlyD
MRVQAGKTVCLEYTLSLADGTVIDSSATSGTWTYLHGHTRMPPGLEKGVEGRGIGERLQLALAPEEAFGPINAAAFEDLPASHFPAAVLSVGYAGEIPGPGGTIIAYRIHAIQGDTVTIDLNHPLAGKHVIFDVTVLHVQD